MIKSKVKGKTVVKDKVKIPDGLQPLVERQARHEADRAGGLQYVDNPYAPGGPKFGFNFTTGRAPVKAQATTPVVKPVEASGSTLSNQRGKRGGFAPKPYVKRPMGAYPRYSRPGPQPYHQHRKFEILLELVRQSKCNETMI